MSRKTKQISRGIIEIIISAISVSLLLSMVLWVLYFIFTLLNFELNLKVQPLFEKANLYIKVLEGTLAPLLLIIKTFTWKSILVLAGIFSLTSIIGKIIGKRININTHYLLTKQAIRKIDK